MDQQASRWHPGHGRRTALRCQANAALIRQSRPDSGRGLQVKASPNIVRCCLFAVVDKAPRGSQHLVTQLYRGTELIKQTIPLGPYRKRTSRLRGGMLCMRGPMPSSRTPRIFPAPDHRHQIAFLRSLICIVARRNPATCGENRGQKKTRCFEGSGICFQDSGFGI